VGEGQKVNEVNLMTRWVKYLMEDLKEEYWTMKGEGQEWMEVMKQPDQIQVLE
jgi:hypothetical protein